MALNRWEGIGNVGNAPEVKQVGELKVANFSVAVNEKAKGETVTTWFRCTAFGKLAEIVESYVTKGSKVFVEGRIVRNEWTGQDGTKHTDFGVTLSNLQMLGDKPNGDAAPATAAAPTAATSKPADLEGF